jgi:hypothetical protein
MACRHGHNAGQIESVAWFRTNFLSRARLSVQGEFLLVMLLQCFIDVKIGTSYINHSLFPKKTTAQWPRQGKVV